MRWLFYWMSEFSVKLKGWRTALFNAIAAIVPFLQMTEVANVIPPPWLPWYALAIAMANIYLRKQTTTPMGVSS